MKYIIIAVLVFSLSVQASEGFDREQALSENNEECQLEFALAMGLSAQKEKGFSKRKLRKIAKKSKKPKVMSVMVDELFTAPELSAQTFVLYRFERCLISKSQDSTPVKLDAVRASLLECEAKSAEMHALVGCIDIAILNETNKRKQQALTK